MDPHDSPLLIPAWKVTRSLLVIIAGLTFAAVVGAVVEYGFGYDYGLGLIPLFDMNRERNLPTWYASATLLIAAFLLAVIAAQTGRAKQRGAAHWSLLSVLFVFLSLDEAISLHEPWNEALQHFRFTGVFYYGWVIPYSTALLLGAVLCVKFFKGLAPKTRNLFLAAATLYLSGALGMELISGNYLSKTGRMDGAVAAMGIIEELLEMLGVAVFIHALLLHIGVLGACLKVQPDESSKPLLPSRKRITD